MIVSIGLPIIDNNEMIMNQGNIPLDTRLKNIGAKAMKVA